MARKFKQSLPFAIAKRKIATAAGTFDSFHKGHEEFLLAAFDAADTIYIAITSDAFAKQTRPHEEISQFSHRRKHVEAFLKKHNLLSRSKFIELDDIYGPTLDSDCPIEAVIVTKKTRYGAQLINKLRTKKGLAPLAIGEVAYIKASDGGDLSSFRIRVGEIDRQGKAYIKPEWLRKTLRLPDTIRPLLQRPIGELIEGSEDNLSKAVSVIKQNLHPRGGVAPAAHLGGGKNFIVTVGDVVTKSFNEEGLAMDIAIVDYRVKRIKAFKNLSEIGFKKSEPDAIAENPKGTLTGETFQAVQESFLSLRVAKQRGNLGRDRRAALAMTTPYVIRVIGEEDLVTLAVILAAPLGTHVYYGQPNEGIVDAEATEEKKSEIRDIVSQFTSNQ